MQFKVFLLCLQASKDFRLNSVDVSEVVKFVLKKPKKKNGSSLETKPGTNKAN